MSTNTIPAQLLAGIKARKFSSLSKLFAPGVDFQAWNPAGHWVASDGTTASRIIEVWYTPGASSTIVYSNETSGAKGTATLEIEVSWKLPPEEQVRVLRQFYALTIKGDKIIQARVYCAGLHTEFPEVDLDKQRRSRGLGPGVPGRPGAATAPAPRVAAAAKPS